MVEIQETVISANPVLTETVTVTQPQALPASSAALMSESEVAVAKNVDGKSRQAAVPAPEVEASQAAPESSAEAQGTPQTPEPQQPQDKASKRFAALSRKEKALRERETFLKAQEQKLQAYEQAAQMAKQDPIAFTKHFGITPDDYVNRLIGTNQEPQTKEQVLEQKLMTVEQKMAHWDAQIKQEAQKQQEQYWHNQVSTFKNTVVKPLIDNNSDKYELIKLEYGDSAADTLWDTVNERLKIEQREFRNPDDTMSFLQETADAIEEHLLQEARKLAVAKKLGGTSIPASSQENARAQTASKTLTNKLNATASLPQSNKGLTVEQSKRRAAQWLQQQFDREKTK